MKKSELTKLRNKKSQELEKIINDKKFELTKTMAELAAGSEKNLKKARMLRHDIAQTKTLLKENELISKLKKDKEK